MNVSTFLEQVSFALRGVDDAAPQVGTEDANYWIATLNRKKNELYEDTNVLWDETWELKSLGSVTASATPSFNTDTTLIAPSDKVVIVDSNSHRRDYDIIKPRQRLASGRQFYLAGMNPQVLHCTNAIKADEDIVGGTIYLPGYYMPQDVSETDGSAVLPFLDPYWAVLATAAEVAFGDIIYEDKVEGLNTKANNLYMKMVRKNRRGTYSNPRKNPTDVYKIRNTEAT